MCADKNTTIVPVCAKCQERFGNASCGNSCATDGDTYKCIKKGICHICNCLPIHYEAEFKVRNIYTIIIIG